MIGNLIICLPFILLIYLIHLDYSQDDRLSYGVVPKSLYFDKNVNLSVNNGTSQNPQIAAVGKNVYVVWEDNDTYGNKEIYFTHSLDNGNTFRPIDNLSSNNSTSQNPQIAAVGKNVYVVWENNDTYGNKEIYFTHSLDNGNTFRPIDNLSSNNSTSQNPQIAAVGKNVYVVWEDNDNNNTKTDILLKPSINEGSSFKSTRQLTKNLSGTADSPQITAVGKNVYVVWQHTEKENKEVYFKTSPNNGTGFRESKNLSNNNSTSINPQLAAVGKNVYVVWEDDRNQNKEIYVKVSSNNGATFQNTKKLTSTIGISQFPQVKVLDSQIYIIWQDTDTIDLQNEKKSKNTKQTRIFFKHGDSEKMVFGNIQKVKSIGNILSPKLLAGDEFFSGIWIVSLPNNLSTLEFYPFGLFEDYSGTGIPLTDFQAHISNPVLTASGDNIFIVWQNQISNNNEIYFKKISTNTIDHIS